MIMNRHVMHLALIFLGILGVWLLYWNLVEFLTLGLNQGIWNISILEEASTSIIVGIGLIAVVFFLGVRVVK